MVSGDFLRVVLDKEQCEHRFESVSYILDLYKGKLIEKLQGKRKLQKLQSEPEILSDFDMLSEKWGICCCKKVPT